MAIRPSNRQIHPNYNAYHQKPKHKRVTHEFVDESSAEGYKGQEGVLQLPPTLIKLRTINDFAGI